MLRNVVGLQATAALLLFGEVVDGAEAERCGLVWRCVDDDALLDAALEMGRRAAAAPRELVERTKATAANMREVIDHDTAVQVELVEQVWSMGQPAFAERLAALQARITRPT